MNQLVKIYKEMTHFCDICGILLEDVTSAVSFHRYCDSCSQMTLPTINDTLFYADTKTVNYNTLAIILKNAARDPTSPAIRGSCEKCGDVILKMAMSPAMELIDICSICNSFWPRRTRPIARRSVAADEDDVKQDGRQAA